MIRKVASVLMMILGIGLAVFAFSDSRDRTVCGMVRHMPLRYDLRGDVGDGGGNCCPNLSSNARLRPLLFKRENTSRLLNGGWAALDEARGDADVQRPAAPAAVDIEEVVIGKRHQLATMSAAIFQPASLRYSR